LLVTLNRQSIDLKEFQNALYSKMEERDHLESFRRYSDTIVELSESDELKKYWQDYARTYAYAEDISYDDTIIAISWLMQDITQAN